VFVLPCLRTAFCSVRFGCCIGALPVGACLPHYHPSTDLDCGSLLALNQTRSARVFSWRGHRWPGRRFGRRATRRTGAHICAGSLNAAACAGRPDDGVVVCHRAYMPLPQRTTTDRLYLLFVLACGMRKREAFRSGRSLCRLLPLVRILFLDMGTGGMGLVCCVILCSAFWAVILSNMSSAGVVAPRAMPDGC